MSHDVTQPEEAAVRIERDFDADADRLWSAIADPDRLREWWDAEIPMVEGGDGSANDPDGPAYIHVEEVDPPRRLVFRWASDAEAPTRVELDVESTESGSRLTVTERPVTNGDHVATMSAAFTVAA